MIIITVFTRFKKLQCDRYFWKVERHETGRRGQLIGRGVTLIDLKSIRIPSISIVISLATTLNRLFAQPGIISNAPCVIKIGDKTGGHESADDHRIHLDKVERAHVCKKTRPARSPSDRVTRGYRAIMSLPRNFPRHGRWNGPMLGLTSVSRYIISLPNFYPLFPAMPMSAGKRNDFRLENSKRHVFPPLDRVTIESSWSLGE